MKKLICMICLTFAVSGCSHRELKAPCSLGDAPKPVAFTGNDDVLKIRYPSAYGYNSCGPMRPINSSMFQVNKDDR